MADDDPNDRRIDVAPGGAVTLATPSGACGREVGRSRPVFRVEPGVGECAGRWHVDLDDDDNALAFDTEPEAAHVALVLQAVMDRHLEAAREEGRRSR